LNEFKQCRCRDQSVSPERTAGNFSGSRFNSPITTGSNVPRLIRRFNLGETVFSMNRVFLWALEDLMTHQNGSVNSQLPRGLDPARAGINSVYFIQPSVDLINIRA
jgi:hypothetical protein